MGEARGVTHPEFMGMLKKTQALATHAGNEIVRLMLECSARECVLRIEDDGRGFDVSQITRADPSGRGAGLFTMKERVSLLGGTCSITSQLDKGTEVVVRVPLWEDLGNGKDTGADS